MAFLATDNLRIMSALRLSIVDLPLIDDAMTEVSSNSAMVLKVQALLTEIEELETGAITEQSNPNFALTRADVLQWDGKGARTLGFTIALYQKIKELGRYLGLIPDLSFEESLLNNANINVGNVNNFMVLTKTRN